MRIFCSNASIPYKFAETIFPTISRITSGPMFPGTALEPAGAGTDCEQDGCDEKKRKVGLSQP